MGHVYAITEVVGSSAKGLEDAIEGAVSTASRTLRNLEWFEVTQIRGHLEGGFVAHYQVLLKLGFRYEEGMDHPSGSAAGSAPDRT